MLGRRMRGANHHSWFERARGVGPRTEQGGSVAAVGRGLFCLGGGEVELE